MKMKLTLKNKMTRKGKAHFSVARWIVMSSKNFKVAMYLALMTSLLYTSYVSAAVDVLLINNQISFNITSVHIRVKSFGGQYIYDKKFSVNMPGPHSSRCFRNIPAASDPNPANFAKLFFSVKSEYYSGGHILLCGESRTLVASGKLYFATIKFIVWRNLHYMNCGFEPKLPITNQ